MPPNRIIRTVVGHLMAAYHECHSFDPATAPHTTVMFYSSNHHQFGLDGSWRAKFKELAAKCNVWLDQYPLQEFERFLQTVVADAKEASVSDAATSVGFGNKLEGFFKSIGDSPEWEVVHAVFGLAAAQPPFSVGPCRFFIMDEGGIHRWGQRRQRGCYDPPLETAPFHDRLGLARQLLGNWVGCLRVRAIDTNHATAMAKYRLEEVLNVLRHSAFLLALPEQCVRAGVGHPNYWNNQAMCVRVHPPGGFQDSAGKGANGLTIETCSLLSRAWPALQTLVAKETTARTTLEANVMTALEWVGQSAAAVLEPVRLVSLMTALEVLVLLEGEALGKRSKLSRRVARIVQSVQSDTEGVEEMADRLYQVRSECLHAGRTQVEDDDIRTAYGFVDAVITAFLTKNPFCNCESLAKVLDHIRDTEDELVYSI